MNMYMAKLSSGLTLGPQGDTNVTTLLSLGPDEESMRASGECGRSRHVVAGGQ